jgi:hypothetical protein
MSKPLDFMKTLEKSLKPCTVPCIADNRLRQSKTYPSCHTFQRDYGYLAAPQKKVVNPVVIQILLVFFYAIYVGGKNEIGHTCGCHEAVGVYRILLVPEDNGDPFCLAICRQVKDLFAAAVYFAVPQLILALPCRLNKYEIGLNSSISSSSRKASAQKEHTRG